MKTAYPMALVGAVTLLAFAGSAHATSYKFSVSCQNERKVVEWRTGDIDPGKEYLRVATGTRNAGCSVSDYDQTADANARVEVMEGFGGLVGGLPPSAVLCGIFKC